MSTKKSPSDWVESTDDNFYTQVKKIVTVLNEPAEPPPGVPAPAAPAEKWQAWGIPESKMSKLETDFTEHEKRYLIAQAKTDRTSADVDDHRDSRKTLQKYLREFVKQYIRYEDQVPRSEKIRMTILPADETPTPEVALGAIPASPDVKLKPTTGGDVDAQFRRPDDGDRASVPDGYECELRTELGGSLAEDPEDISNKNTFFSTKAKFKMKLGMTNRGKKLRAYARFKHKRNPALSSAWAEVEVIFIS